MAASRAPMPKALGVAFQSQGSLNEIMRQKQQAPGNGGVLMPSHTSGDPGFYAKKRAREAEIGRELTDETCDADWAHAMSRFAAKR